MRGIIYSRNEERRKANVDIIKSLLDLSTSIISLAAAIIAYLTVRK